MLNRLLLTLHQNVASELYPISELCDMSVEARLYWSDRASNIIQRGRLTFPCIQFRPDLTRPGTVGARLWPPGLKLAG